MTLNGHFALKSGPEVGIQWSGVLACGENCSEICRATHIMSAAKNVAQLGTVLVMELFNGITEQEASNQ